MQLAAIHDSKIQQQVIHEEKESQKNGLKEQVGDEKMTEDEDEEDEEDSMDRFLFG